MGYLMVVKGWLRVEIAVSTNLLLRMAASDIRKRGWVECPSETTLAWITGAKF